MTAASSSADCWAVSTNRLGVADVVFADMHGHMKKQTVAGGVSVSQRVASLAGPPRIRA